MKEIATITTYSFMTEKFSLHTNKIYKNRDSRVVGFFDNIEIARDTVIEQSENLFELEYEYLVIEVLAQGLYPEVLNEEWFIYNRKLKIYEPALKPEDLIHCINFCIG